MTKEYDLIIIGGGAAGMMAAISARRHHPDFSIAIIDQTFALGRKILVCGAGRCNITNINLDKDFEKRYYGADKNFIHSIFDKFGYNEIVEFFEELGVDLYVERKTDIGKVFPVTDQAKTITEMLLDEIERNSIEIFLQTKCKSIVKDEEKFLIICEKIEKDGKFLEKIQFESKYLILSAGGKTYPSYGSDGSGYDLAASFGHKIIKPVPSALSLESKNPLSHFLQGTKMEMEVTSIIDGKEIKKSTDDVMFKKYGVSGPAILNISREISIRINREDRSDCEVILNFFPGKDKEQTKEFLETRWRRRPEQTIEKSLFGIFPNKVSLAILKSIDIKPDNQVSQLKREEKSRIIDTLTSTKIKIDGTRGWNEAEFTAGGVDTEDIFDKTLESKKISNLYFAGEIMNVDGDVGGFNLSWSWASGFIAGQLKKS
jgi:hypothetical protein